MAPVGPRSGDAIFSSIDRVVTKKKFRFFNKSVSRFRDKCLILFWDFDKIFVECRVVHIDVRCNRASIAY